MNAWLRDRRSERGQSLIGMLIVLAVVVVVFVIVYGHRPHDPAPTRPGGPTTRLGQSLERGSQVDCQNNLRQIRLAITMERTSDADDTAAPANLDALRKDGITPQMEKCPVTGTAYMYNPQTGQVWCPTPGHEKF